MTEEFLKLQAACEAETNVFGDPARAEQGGSILNELVERIKQYKLDLHAEEARVSMIHRDYDTSGDDLRSEFRENRAARSAHGNRSIQMLSRLRAATTSEEWAAMTTGENEDRGRRVWGLRPTATWVEPRPFPVGRSGKGAVRIAAME